MHQTKKGNQRHFGIKSHTEVDAGNGFAHTLEAAAAIVCDVTVAAKLLREGGGNRPLPLCLRVYANSFKHSSMDSRAVICGWFSPGSIGLSIHPMSR